MKYNADRTCAGRVAVRLSASAWSANLAELSSALLAPNPRLRVALITCCKVI
jgi:hypothetical protein